MMKRSVVAAVALAGLGMPVAAAPLTPLAVSGYNQDIVVDGGAPFYRNTVTANMDYGSDFPSNPQPDITTWYATGVGGSPRGLPTGTTFSTQADPNTRFTLQPANTNNAVLLGFSTPTAHVTLSTPASFSALAFLTASGNGSAGLSVVGDLASGGTVALGSIASPDWFNSAPIAISAGGRASVFRNQLFDYGGGSPSLFDEALPLAAVTGTLTGFDLTWTGGSNSTAIMGISGATPVPEPVSLALLGVGLLGLGFVRARSRPVATPSRHA